MAEKDFKKWLIVNANKDWMFQTIETSTGSGVPDVYFCIDGYQGWIELKSSTSNHCYARISQWRWFCKLCSRGGFGLLIIKREKLKRVDVYLARDLTGPEIAEQSELRGNDIIFPPDIKPAFSYKLGTGNQKFYEGLIELFKKEY